jgi:hypothetical protein
LYSFGFSEISFRAGNQPNAKAIRFLPADSVDDTPAPKSVADSGIATVSAPDGLTLIFPAGDRDPVATLESPLPEVTPQKDLLYTLTYQVDGAATLDLDFKITGADASGAWQSARLGTRLLEPFSRGTLVFAAPPSALRDVRVQVTVAKLVGSPEFRAASVTLSQFKIARQTRVPNKQAQPTAPVVSIDGKPVALSPMPVSEERTGTWFTSQPLNLSEGSHSIFAGYDDSIAPYRIGFVEIAPAQAPPLPAASGAPAISFRQINPTRYLAHVENAAAPFFLVFSESFHAGWQAYAQDGQGIHDATWYEQSALLRSLLDGGKRTEIADHNLVNGYANSWYVQRKGSYNIVLEFGPQRLYEAGVFVTISTPVACFVLLAALWLKRKGKGSP